MVIFVYPKKPKKHILENVAKKISRLHCQDTLILKMFVADFHSILARVLGPLSLGRKSGFSEGQKREKFANCKSGCGRCWRRCRRRRRSSHTCNAFLRYPLSSKLKYGNLQFEKIFKNQKNSFIYYIILKFLFFYQE